MINRIRGGSLNTTAKTNTTARIATKGTRPLRSRSLKLWYLILLTISMPAAATNTATTKAMFEPLMPKSLNAHTVPATTPAAAGLAKPMK
ncbi:hypothetical protein D9M68_867150 [compost metagenome]